MPVTSGLAASDGAEDVGVLPGWDQQTHDRQRHAPDLTCRPYLPGASIADLVLSPWLLTDTVACEAPLSISQEQASPRWEMRHRTGFKVSDVVQLNYFAWLQSKASGTLCTHFPAAATP
jgi:hypothetical protein